MDHTVFYLHDPLCGWCYGAIPAMRALRQAGVAVTPVPTGLFSGSGRTMDQAFAAYAWTNDQRIGALTGQPFTTAYRTQVLGALGTAFDSAAATLALAAVAEGDPTREFDALYAIQAARYVDGRDIVALPSLITILSEAGFADAAALLGAPDAALRAFDRARVARGRALMQAVGAQGVPALVVEGGAGLRAVRSDALFGGIEALLAQLRPASSAA
ncbi:DsbA family protein [Beijerinckia sp. L45]|uniref:DsbA family protein n=1 Tax=Beijerinckia sp. L45 TaxID=1641855 RepID=UPI00131B3F35|nr:DsbA family protein [Beijerinckia sp. L45]